VAEEASLGARYRERAQADPVWWINTFLGLDLWPKQVEIAEAIRDYPKVAVRSCHASGKTFEAAALALWFAYSFPESMTITTAPGYRQVRENMWGEIAKAYRGAKIPLTGHFTPKSCRLELGPRWGAVGFATDQTERLSGYHRDSMLVIVDEASGIDEILFQGIEGLRSAGSKIRLVLLSQMTRTSGTFFNAFHRDRDQWKCFTIGADDTPNFSPDQVAGWKEQGSPVEGYNWSHPYLINPAWASDMKKTWGPDSDLYRVRVLGVEPKGEASAVIPLYMAEAALERIVPMPTDKQIWMGLDVARQGDDFCYIFIRRGPVVLYGEQFSPASTNPTEETIGWALEIATRFGVTDINCDDIGVGAGVFDGLAAIAPMRGGIHVHPINAGSKPRDTEHFLNRRAEDYMGLRQRFETGEITLTNIAHDPAGPAQIDRLLPELTGLQWKPITPSGKLVLEAKEEYKKRLARSPDAADALMFAFAMPDDQLNIYTMFDNEPEGFGADLAPEPEVDSFLRMDPD
jgi:phage terminase large subunit